jgi:outer membrane receptor protein involved in Fe transport
MAGNRKKKNAPRGMFLLIWAILSMHMGVFEAGADQARELPPFEETELMFVGEELYTVSIASRRVEPLQRAPAAVTVISGEELKKYRTLAEALRRVPGFFIDRNEVKERIYLRGVPDSFLVLMDGVPFASDASTQDYPRGMELSLNYIEKIEIIRGPGSALWGPDAFSGIVNLVTKKGADLQGIKLQVELGSYETTGMNVVAGFNKKGWDAFMSVSASETEGFEGDLQPLKTRKKDHYFELYGKVSYKDVLEISGRHSNYRDFYTEPNNFYEGSEHKPFSFLQATFNKTMENSSLALQTWFQFFDNLDDYEQISFEQENRQYGIEGKYDRTFFTNHYATIGASFRYNNGGKTTVEFEGEDFDFFGSYDNKLYSVYFQDKWKILENLETTLGIRYDDQTEYERFFSPRAGINYLFWDYFSLKLLYGRAFRTPNLAVLIEQSGLDPERIDSYEIALGFHYKNIFNIEFSYFYNELDDIIERDATGEIRNRGSEDIEGVEVAVNGRLHRSLAYYASYSHLFGDRQKGSKTTQEIPSEDPEEEPVESTLESFFNVAPDNVFTFGIDYSFLRHCRANLELHYVSKRKLARGLVTTFGSGRQLSSYLLADFSLFVEDFPLKNLEMALKIKNLTNESYKTRGVFGFVDGEGSSMYFTLSYKF